MFDEINLGLCCICAERPATNILMLPYKSPDHHGWGCFQCGLPMEGATAVICDECFPGVNKELDTIRYIVIGDPAENNRVPYTPEMLVPFKHDMSKH